MLTLFSVHAAHNYVAAPMTFKPLSEMERNRSIGFDSPTVPKYEISDSESQVCWYNDDTELVSDGELNIQRDTNQSTKISDTGDSVFGSPDDPVSFKMESQGDFPANLKIQTN